MPNYASDFLDKFQQKISLVDKHGDISQAGPYENRALCLDQEKDASPKPLPKNIWKVAEGKGIDLNRLRMTDFRRALSLFRGEFLHMTQGHDDGAGHTLSHRETLGPAASGKTPSTRTTKPHPAPSRSNALPPLQRPASTSYRRASKPIIPTHRFASSHGSLPSLRTPNPPATGVPRRAQSTATFVSGRPPRQHSSTTTEIPFSKTRHVAYTPYGLEDTRAFRMAGSDAKGLGPDFDSDAYLHKLNKRVRQQAYAERLRRQQWATAPSRPASMTRHRATPPLAPSPWAGKTSTPRTAAGVTSFRSALAQTHETHQAAIVKRERMKRYAGTVPKPRTVPVKETQEVDDHATPWTSIDDAMPVGTDVGQKEAALAGEMSRLEMLTRQHAQHKKLADTIRHKMARIRV